LTWQYWVSLRGPKGFIMGSNRGPACAP